MILDKFLKEQKILRLSTIDPNGIPHVVPVWYRYDKKKIQIGTNSKTIKIKNLEKNRNVAFCVDIGVNAPDIYGVMGSGKAKLRDDKDIVSKIAKEILSRYFEDINNKSAQELLEDTDRIIEIIPERISKWHY